MKRLGNIGKWDSRKMSSHPILDSESCTRTVRGEENLFRDQERCRKKGNMALPSRTYNSNYKKDIIHSPTLGYEGLDIYSKGEEDPCQGQEDPDQRRLMARSALRLWGTLRANTYHTRELYFPGPSRPAENERCGLLAVCTAAKTIIIRLLRRQREG